MAKSVKWIDLPGGSRISVVCYLPGVSVCDSRSPVLFMLGYGGAKSAPYRALLQGTADALQVPVYVLEYANPPDLTLITRCTHIFRNRTQAWKQFLVQTTLCQIARQSPTEKVTLFGYSEGAMHAVVAAYEHIDLVDRLVLIAGAGYSGKESLISIFVRAGLNSIDRRWVKLFGSQNAKQQIAEYEAAIKEYSRTYFGALPIWRRWWAEISDAVVPGRVDVIDQIADIQEKRKVYCLHYTKDKMLNIEHLRKRLKDLIGRRFFSLRGIHSEVLTNPNETLMVIQVLY